jgi:hypothetical protein
MSVCGRSLRDEAAPGRQRSVDRQNGKAQRSWL